MTFFELLTNTFYTKKEQVLDSESSQYFNGYMFNRWLSFYSDNLAIFTNDTLNKFGYIFDTDKQSQYSLFFNLIPKLRYKHIKYIKKKKEKIENGEAVPLNQIAKHHFMSSKELQQYVDLAKEIAN